MPHYTGETNFSEERRKMSENTPENTQRTEQAPPQPGDSVPGSGEAPATQPNPERTAQPEEGVPADSQQQDTEQTTPDGTDGQAQDDAQ